MRFDGTIEAALERALQGAIGPDTPPGLVGALRHAVFGGGKRLRPQLVLRVAEAAGNRHPELALAAATAVELIHCASLVHDDLPAFDDAPLRRGRPTVHRAFGEPLAVLAGDALIVLAFQVLADGGRPHPVLLPRLVTLLARGTGAPSGIVAGQAWESEASVNLSTYHRQKTGALFEAAVQLGALAGGGEPEAWEGLGLRLGEAYQVADDLQDLLADPAQAGKLPRDVARGRPNAALAGGVEGAARRLATLAEDTVAAVPPCPGRRALRSLVHGWLVGWVPAPAATPRPTAVSAR